MQCAECLSYDCDCPSRFDPRRNRYAGDSTLSTMLRAAGFDVETATWHNDDCASIYVGHKDAPHIPVAPVAQVFIDAEDREARERGGERYAVWATRDDGSIVPDGDGEPACLTDDRDAVVAAVRAIAARRGTS